MQATRDTLHESSGNTTPTGGRPSEAAREGEREECGAEAVSRVWCDGDGGGEPRASQLRLDRENESGEIYT